MSAKPNAEVSITDVAALANVSTATVSRVLSGRRQKDDDIARRVRKAAKQLHYAVNLAASSLRSEVTNTLGFVCPDPHHPMAASLLEAFVAACDKLDRHVFVNFGNTSEEQARLVNAMAARRVDGLAVVPPYGACRHATPMPSHISAAPWIHGKRPISTRNSKANSSPSISPASRIGRHSDR